MVGGWADPLIKPAFNLKKGPMKGDHRGAHAEPLEGGCYGIRASGVQSAPKAHLTQTLPW